MVLEFQPYFQPDRNRDRESLAGLNQTVGGIGNDWQQYGQQSRENKIRQAMLQLQQQHGQREQQVHNYEYGDPNAAIPNDGLSPETGQPMTMAEPQMPQGGYGGGTPNGAASPSGSGQQPTSMPTDNGVSPQTGQPMSMPGQPMHQPGTDLTSHFQAWQSQGQPPQYNHPQMGGQPQQPQGANPNDPYGLGVNMRQVGAKSYGMVDEEAHRQASGRVLSASPMAKSIFGSSSPQDIELAGIDAGKVIPEMASLQSSQNYKNAQLGLANQRFGLDENKFGDTKLEQVQKAYSGDENVKKAQGTLDKVTQAIPLLQSGQIDNATAKQALTTAMTYMATGGQRVNDVELKQFGGAHTLSNRMAQWVKGLDAGTLTARDASDMAQVLGYFQKSAQQNLQQAGMRYAQQLSQRTGERPEDAYKRVTGSDFSGGGTGGGQNGGGQQYQSIKRNPKTGQTIGWDGKQWQIIQQ